MTGFLKHSFNLPKIVCNYNKHLSQRCFSAVSITNNDYRSNNSFIHPPCKIVKIQHRNFSFDFVQKFFNSVASSESCILVKNILINFHDFSGLPWYATVISASLALRLFIGFPCAVYQKYLDAKLENTKQEINNCVPALREKVLAKAQKEKWTQTKLDLQYRLELMEQRRELIVKNNCHPVKILLLSYIQLPFWLLLTLAVRGFAVGNFANDPDTLMHYLQFQCGGLFWCKNLTQSDPFLILPAISFISILMSSEIAHIINSIKLIDNQQSKKKLLIATKILPNAVRFLAVCFFCISAISPSGVSLFWASSSALNLGQNLLLMSPKVKKAFRIPATPSDLDKPYSFVWNSVLHKFVSLFVRQ